MNINLDLKELARLLRLLEKRNIAEFELEDDKLRLRVVRGGRGHASAGGGHVIEAAPVQAAASVVSTVPAVDDASITCVTSPFVGTFYRSPSPDAPPFVEVGSASAKGRRSASSRR